MMRRSTAPSLRQGAKFVSPSSEREPVHFHLARETHSAAPFPNAIRSTASILDLLSSSRTASPDDESPNDDYVRDMIAVPSISTACAISREAKASSVQLLKAENVDRNQIISQRYKGKRLFNVVWGKQSKKKHKTWEGDGILEVGEKTVILKDTDGKIIGQCSGMKTATIEEGSRLFVGSKEVEIIDVAGSSDAHDAQSDNCGNTGSKRLPDSTTSASVPVLKKPRKTSPQPALFSFQKHKGPEKPLIMPPPTHEHQVQK